MAQRWKFSPSMLGWYLVGLDYPNAPDDLVDVPAETWQVLQGKQIEAGPDGMPREWTAPAPTEEEIRTSLLAAVDARLNTAAQARGYDSIVTAALRAALPSSPFHAEGVAYGTWMDQTYAHCYAVLAQVQAGERPIPTEAELMAELPPPPEF
ncbi:MAG: hypothetical protein DI563_01915 [Variovorax paradoxus]|uniref:Uncharacterized protein n=1 Tax=Variovorax paradoxus TaxID=34073 RepID=A0A2W5QKY9_VARPD|nr:MAG: hypothetical protein DI563_01915 [Variovorax paradoxus]